MVTQLTLDLLTNLDQRRAVLLHARHVASQLLHHDGDLWWDLFSQGLQQQPNTAKASSPKQILQAIQFAQRYVWEKLHQGVWHEVSPWWRAAYRCTNIITAVALYWSASASGSLEQSKKALFEIDIALIMSGPFQTFNVDNIIHELVQDIRRRQVRAVQPIDRQHLPQQQRSRATKRPRIEDGTEAAEEAPGEAVGEAAPKEPFPHPRRPLSLPPPRLSLPTHTPLVPPPSQLSALPKLKHELIRTELVVSQVKRLQQPSMLVFKTDVFDPRCPHVIEGIVNQWPACKRWNMDYLSALAGPRTVPVEIGQNYMSKEWTQQLMTLDTFINTYVKKQEGKEPQRIAYLAQHELFDQIPELSRDLIEPDYCIFSDAVAVNGAATNSSTATATAMQDHLLLPQVQRNSWFGPSSTVSPLHHDKYHNLFCQVFGSKTIVLIDPMYSCYLSPNVGVQCNTSQVDLQREGWSTRWPDMKHVQCQIVTVRAGEMLYIPPKWWHFCVAEEISFSVSYWWSGEVAV